MYLVNLDWLELLFQMDHPEMLINPQDVYIKNSTLSLVKTTDLRFFNQYKNPFDIFIDDRKVGHLFKDPVINPLYRKNNIISVWFDNQVLYDTDTTSILETLLEGLKLSFYGISRIDICVDTDEDIQNRFKEMYNDIENFSMKYRNPNGTNSNQFINGTGKFDKRTEIGSLKNRKRMIVFYDKSLELEKGNKPYISKLHQEIFRHKQVERIELRLFRKEFSRNKELYIDIYKLNDKNYLEGIFKHFFDEMIDFRRINKSDSCKSRYERIDLIKLNETSEVLKKPLIIEDVHNNSYTKYLVKTLHNDSKKDEFKKQRKEMIELRDRYIKEFGLEDYFTKKLSNG